MKLTKAVILALVLMSSPYVIYAQGDEISDVVDEIGLTEEDSEAVTDYIEDGGEINTTDDLYEIEDLSEEGINQIIEDAAIDLDD